MEEKGIALRLPDEWDDVGTNVVYSHPLNSEIAPQGFVYQHKGTNPVGEKDVMTYLDESVIGGRVGYIEVKCNDSYEEEARNQLERAQKYWNGRGYDFTGGFSTGEDIRLWNGSEVTDETLEPEEFSPEKAPTLESDGVSPRNLDNNQGSRITEILLDCGWDEAHEDVLYGEPLESTPEGMIGSNAYNSHFGHMDVIACAETDDGVIIGHVERQDEEISNIEGRIDFSKKFWERHGYSFQAGLYDGEGIMIRDFDNDEWIQ